ncbi:MAG: ABC transporter permease, partial [Deferribacterota bacterium]|nr:ABC transporter permease [Deferribacterota bacterium]
MKRVRLFFEIAIKMLLVHKQRTALSILGVLSGIAMLISVNNISRSTMENTKELLEKFGPELIVVEPAKVRVVGKGKTDYVPTTKLNFRDVELMRNNLIDVKNIVPVVNMGANAVYLGKSTKTTISGATKDIFDMRK